MTILNNLECLYRPMGDECGNTAKGKLGGVREVLRQDDTTEEGKEGDDEGV